MALIPVIIRYTILLVSVSGVKAIFIFRLALSTIEPKTTIKIMGNRREKTTAVGLLHMETRLALAMAMAAFRLLYRSGINSDKLTQFVWLVMYVLNLPCAVQNYFQAIAE